MKTISQEELNYFEKAIQALPQDIDTQNLALRNDTSGLFLPSVTHFLDIVSRLADYADAQCWFNLNAYYVIVESELPAMQEDLLGYVLTNRALFQTIIARYRDAEGV